MLLIQVTVGLQNNGNPTLSFFSGVFFSHSFTQANTQSLKGTKPTTKKYQSNLK
jgi:hypothetical protein